MIPGVPQPAFYIFKCQQSAPPGMPKPSCVSQNDPESAQLFQHLAQSLDDERDYWNSTTNTNWMS